MADDPIAPAQPTDDAPNDAADANAGAAWWGRALTRRQFSKLSLDTAALLALSGAATACGSKSEPAPVPKPVVIESPSEVKAKKDRARVAKDARKAKADAQAAEPVKATPKTRDLDTLDAQKEHGWDVGASSNALTFKDAKAKDSLGGAAWKGYLDPAKLIRATQPKREAFRAYASPALFQSLEQASLAKQARPVANADMEIAALRGRALGSLVAASEDPSATLLVLDLPGPKSVALASGLADTADLAFQFDNWPHPNGAVPSHQTLGATLYYADHFAKQAAKRPNKAPLALVLDANRLNPARSSATFDNRYIANVPDAKALKKLGIKRILYVTDTVTKQELDDLNDPFVAYNDVDTNIAALPLDAFARDEDVPPGPATLTGGYYYGGSRAHHTYFFIHYSAHRYVPSARTRAWPTRATAPPASVAAVPTYAPTPRKTLFSNRTSGARTGVGRTKPTGFGRVSMRVDSSGKVVSVGTSKTRASSSSKTTSTKTTPTKSTGSGSSGSTYKPSGSGSSGSSYKSSGSGSSGSSYKSSGSGSSGSSYKSSGSGSYGGSYGRSGSSGSS